MPNNHEPDPEATEEFQQEFGQAYEEVMTDLEATRETLHGSIESIADAVKGSLLSEK